MRFKRENWQSTIGDKYALIIFDGLVFAWQKSQLEDTTNFKESYELCGSESVHYEKVFQNPVIGEVSEELSIDKLFI